MSLINRTIEYTSDFLADNVQIQVSHNFLSDGSKVYSVHIADRYFNEILIDANDEKHAYELTEKLVQVLNFK